MALCPTIRQLKSAGYLGTALATVPTTTNTNNTSIVTGVPPAIHGINGEFCCSTPETGGVVILKMPGSCDAAPSSER